MVTTAALDWLTLLLNRLRVELSSKPQGHHQMGHGPALLISQGGLHSLRDCSLTQKHMLNDPSKKGSFFPITAWTFPEQDVTSYGMEITSFQTFLHPTPQNLPRQSQVTDMLKNLR